jgi:methionyl-tRNA formyltransferase
MSIKANKKQNIIILTGSGVRHKFFIQYLNYHFSISEVYIEESDYPNPIPKSKEESIAWDWFFKRRDQYEKKLILESSRLTQKNSPRITYLEKKTLNNSSTIANIKKINPGFIAVFGTGILQKPFLKLFSGCLFNLHVGDPEFYRGSSCNFWPIHQGELQRMSATIHQIDQGIDTGDILFRQAVTLSKDDNEQTLLLKPLELGTKLMVKTIKSWQNGGLQPITQNRTGKLFKKNDFTPKAILDVKQMVESGKLKDYIENQNTLINKQT